MDYPSLRLSLFANNSSYTSTLKPLTEIIRLIQYDNIVAVRTQQYREMCETMGKNTANKHIKQKLMPAFGVAVLFKGLGHSSEQADGWTGLAMCDIDDIDDADELEAAFLRLRADPHVLLLYRTISGRGLRAIYSYERERGQKIDDTSWRAAFFLGNEQLAMVAGHPFDAKCCDATRLSGLAGDPRLHVNLQAVPFVIPDDLIVEQNCEYQEHGRPRKEYGSGTFHPQPEEAWPRVEQMLAEKKQVYAPGQHHNYILHASYLFNRFGTPLDALLEWASQEWADHDREERERAIRHKYKDTARHGTWKLSGKVKGRENAMVTLPELRQYLEAHILVRYNLVTDQLLWRAKGAAARAAASDEEVPLTSAEWQTVDETMVNTLRYQAAFDTGKRVLKSDVEGVLNSDFAKKVHPVRQFIERLPDWDGHDRIAQLAGYIHAGEPSSLPVPPSLVRDGPAPVTYLEWSLRKWLVAMVATWMDDKVENHCIFTIIGPQGIYKTTFFRHLLPPPLHGYFIENAHNSFSGKDDRLALSENCLVEIEEVEAIGGKELSELKSLVTSQTIKERRPYAKFRETKARLASFCASGNEQHILTDATGNRRWLCHLVSTIDNPRRWELDYEQFYAQLRHDYQEGFQYWFTSLEEDYVTRQNAPFLEVSFEEQLITTRFRKPRGHESYKLMNASMIALQICNGRLGQGVTIRKVADVMHSLKFRFTHKRTGNYYHVVEIPFDQQQSYISLPDDVESAEEETPQQPGNEQLELPF